MATYVMGDIHGDYDRFMDMLDKLAMRQGDHLYIVGDAVDRGDYGIELLQFIRENTESMTLLLGNHEHMMLQALSSGDPAVRRNWMLNGGEATFEAYMKLPQEERASLLRWLGELPTSARVTVGERIYHLTHGWSGGERVKDTVWGRPFSQHQENPLPNCTLIIGHTPVCLLAKGSMTTMRYLQYLESQGEHMKILHAPGGYIDLDCGCGHDVYGARLASLQLDNMAEFYV